jgi:hypothetical protein
MQNCHSLVTGIETKVQGGRAAVLEVQGEAKIEVFILSLGSLSTECNTVLSKCLGFLRHHYRYNHTFVLTILLFT